MRARRLRSTIHRMPMLTRLIAFTHIPKTAGSSFVHEMVRPSLSAGAAVEGSARMFPSLSFDARVLFAHGHFMYGVHLLCARPVDYITFLRDPVDRAVSYYSFIKDVPREQLHRYKHPLRDRADALRIDEFFQSPRFCNEQTKYLAGYPLARAYEKSPFSLPLQRLLLQQAVEHLKERYACFGIQSHYEESLERFRDRFGWQGRATTEALQRTGSRPSLGELPERVVRALQRSHHLDYELYVAAEELFRSVTS